MKSIIAASSVVTSQLPFWLQILAIAAAPVIGFIGVGIGVIMAERNRRIAYLIEEKKKVYLDFMDMLAKISTFWSNRFPAVMRDHATTKDVLGFSVPMVESLQRTYIQIRLLGSQRVVDAAGDCFEYTALASITGMQMLATRFDRKEWNNTVVIRGIAAMKNFSDAARSDLGLSNLEIKGSTSAGIPDEIVEYVENTVRSIKSQSISTAQPNDDYTSEPEIDEEDGKPG
jgi:hypothetical protein